MKKYKCNALLVNVNTALFCALVMQAPAIAADLDLHVYWEQRCESCHGHAGAFARRFLHLENGQLSGVHPVGDLNQFLRNHYLNDDLIAPVTAMLKAQVVSRPLFSEKCAGCHGSAAQFVRQSLVMKDGVLTGRLSGRTVADFLNAHGKLEPGQKDIMLDTLSRVHKELSIPVK